MSATHPITQRDVAQACGVHPSTICLALKNSPSIPLETRRRVQAVAEELGYRPNAAARNLALLRMDRAVAGSLPIAWINQEARRDTWHADPEARVCFDSARRRAEENGYHLQEIWTREPGMTAPRVLQILRARGIEGVIFPAHRSFDFSLLGPGWNDFAVVGFNDHRLGEWFDVVCPDYYRNTAVALRALHARGCERIGLVLTPHFEAASSGLVHSCFLRHQADLPADARIPVCLVSAGPEEAAVAFREWLSDHRPDVVLTRERGLADCVRAAGGGTTWVQLHGSAAGIEAGIDACAGEVAATAVDCVIEKLRRCERNRETTRVHLIKGAWHESGVATSPAQAVVA